VDSNISSGRSYFVNNRRYFVNNRRLRHVRLTRGASFVVILLLSLGLWAAIWAALASLPSLGLR